MKKKKVLFFYLFSIHLLCCVGLFQAPKKAMAYDQNRDEIYRSVLTQANSGNYSRISKSLNPLHDVISEIRDRFGVDLISEIDTAVASGDQGKVLSALNKLIYYDIRNIFYTIETTANLVPEEGRELLKAGLANYLVLSPEMARLDGEADERVKKLFAWTFRIVPSKAKSTFTQVKGKGLDTSSMRKLEKLLGLIQQECVKVFPGFDSSAVNGGRLFNFFAKHPVYLKLSRIFFSDNYGFSAKFAPAYHINNLVMF